MNYLASAKTILEILTFTFEQKIEVLKNQESVDGKHPYFNYGEN